MQGVSGGSLGAASSTLTLSLGDRPEGVLTHDPAVTRRLIHRDHRIVGRVVEDAVFPYARDPLHYAEHLREGLEPHRVGEVWLWDSDEPNCAVDVQGYVDAQAAALELHESQTPGLFGGRDLREALEASETPFRRLVAP